MLDRVLDADLAEASAIAVGRRMDGGVVGVVDVGSNSVRLVLYERASRAPTTLFNEKVLAALGEGLSEHGRLSDEAMGRALQAVRRFMAVARAARARDVIIVATAAARMADNGPQFIGELETIAGVKVRVLAGREEAEMAASGVLCGFWQPDGVVGDLGGGSLELIDVRDHRLGPGDSFALGTLRLKSDANNSLTRAAEIVDGVLASSPQLPLLAGRNFYAVGGTWRSLVRLHMAQTGYPLSIMHHYSIPAGEAAALCERIVHDGLDAIPHGDVVSKGRRPLVPWGAVVLRAILARGRPEQVVASALGVREGMIYNALAPEERRRDPMLLAAEELAVLRSRSPRQGAELVAWTAAAFDAMGLYESEEDRRLRTAACLLSDIGWRAHPDYRGDQALAIMSNVALYGVDHGGRSFLSLTLHERYGGLAGADAGPQLERLCPPRLVERARLLAGVFRIAYVLAPGVAGVLPRTRFLRERGDLVLWLPADMADFAGERPLRRMRQLARMVGAHGSVRVG